MDPRRRKWSAILLSLATPGLGHVYLGKPWRALCLFLVVVAGAWLAQAGLLGLPRPLNIGPFLAGVLVLPVVAPFDAWLVTRRTPAHYELRGYNRWYVYLVLWALSALWLLPRLTAFWVRAYRVPSSSMEPTLLIGDFIYHTTRWPLGKRISHGTMVVHASIEEPGVNVVKRVVAVPGDTIEMRDGLLVRNGTPVSEQAPRTTDTTPEEYRLLMRAWQQPHLIGVAPDTYVPDLANWGPLLVPPASFLVLGDNRNNSYDSRFYGFVPLTAIRGVPAVIYFSFDRNGALPLPFLTAIRRSRIGMRLRN